jgi:hypothetical protein
MTRAFLPILLNPDGLPRLALLRHEVHGTAWLDEGVGASLLQAQALRERGCRLLRGIDHVPASISQCAAVSPRLWISVMKTSSDTRV